MDFLFECELRSSPEALFRFHENPAHLVLLSDKPNRVRLLRHAGNVHPGSETWVEQRIGPLPIVLGFQHVLYEPPRRFGEELIHGPFKRFVHIHEFVPHQAGCIVRDLLEINLPHWLGGEPMMHAIVRAQVHKAFRYRHRAYLHLEKEGRFGS
ncbi:MAG: hypothetical protein HYV26_07550 [Candidatus Hydrogenedentes bacterium]|nr:hypothetical protein [Candidatus Hydrogenedentota bacterium]